MSEFKHIVQSLVEKRAESGVTEFKYNISACLFNDSRAIQVTARNDFPAVLAAAFSADDQIGDSSPTIHAEIFAMQSGLACGGLSIAITAPPCPNCTKQLIMSGIHNIFILESGFKTGLWYNSVDEGGVPRKRYFDDLSLVLAKHAGLGVFVINDEGQIVKTMAEFDLHDKNAVRMNSANYACSTSMKGEETRLYEQFTYGMDSQKAEAIREKFSDVPGGLRYRLMIDPLSHLLAYCAKYGKNLKSKSVHITEIPTSRCIVDAVGAGVERISVPIEYQHFYTQCEAGIDEEALSTKTAHALRALHTLENKGIVQVVFEDFSVKYLKFS